MRTTRVPSAITPISATNFSQCWGSCKSPICAASEAALAACGRVRWLWSYEGACRGMRVCGGLEQAVAHIAGEVILAQIKRDERTRECGLVTGGCQLHKLIKLCLQCSICGASTFGSSCTISRGLRNSSVEKRVIVSIISSGCSGRLISFNLCSFRLRFNHADAGGGACGPRKGCWLHR